MTIPANFVAVWEYLHPESAVQMMLSKAIPKGKKLWVLKNEIRPSDLYCYFWARFGAPNGLQNFLRKDDSDNLIHWDWMFKTEFGFLTFLGMNFRTEVHLFGDYPFDESDKVDFLRQVKADFENYGSKMSEVRDQVLESWIEFANPYQRLKRSIATLFEELNSLSLDPDKRKPIQATH